MAKKISDHTETLAQGGDYAVVYRPGSPTSDLRVELAAMMRVISGAGTSYSLVSGAGTLSLDEPVILLTGTASAGFSLLLPNGAATNERITLIVTGSTAAQSILLRNAADSATLSSINTGDYLQLRWTGSAWSRCLVANTDRQLKFGDGDPNGVLTPSNFGQVYYDNVGLVFYQATGETSSSWKLLGGGAGDEDPVDDNSTTLLVGDAINGTFRHLTAGSAIAVTLDAQAAPGTSCALEPVGTGAVTVTPEGGAGYWLEDDDRNGSIRTTAFVLTGYGFFRCDANSGGNAAEWAFYGASNLPIDLGETALLSIGRTTHHVAAASLGSGAVTCDLSEADYFTVTIGGSWNAGTPLVGSNPPASGEAQTVQIVASISGTQTVDLAGLPWLGDAPTLDSADTDVIVLVATWEGSSLVDVVGANRA